MYVQKIYSYSKRYSPMSVVGRVSIEGYRCERCGHIWVPRKYEMTKDKKKEPIICPKCKSPYWNIPKK
jgi:DNA-directed RNA polymerase subunit RPC12/RpoP